MTPAPYGIVGDGRVARHFAHYLGLLGLPCRQWSRRTPTADLDGCAVILLLVSDPAIEELAARYPGQTCVHFSGSFLSERVHGMHPLMSFGRELYALEDYQRIPFVAEDAELFRRLFPALPNPVHAIRREDKARYHALCAMAGNFTGFLWAKLFQDFPAALGIPAEAAIPYLEQVCRNIAATPTEPDRFLTGPIVRGDRAAVQKHLAALQGDAYRPIYEAFARALLDQSFIDSSTSSAKGTEK
jgi:2-dehydropantoate 2-reductase